MNKDDYYSILGLTNSANDIEIKKAYKKLAMKYHPDRNQDDKNAEEKFKKIGEAYEVLSDPNKKQIYDQYGHSGFNYTSDSYSQNTSHFTDIFSEIFGDIFNENIKSKNKTYSQKGADLLHVIKIDLESAANGIQTTFNINVLTKCKKCNGIGAKNQSSFIKCSKCEGRGQIKNQQGFITIQQTCNRCNGSGNIIKDVCEDCYGKGRINTEKTLSTKIPPGINDNDRIKLNGEGEAGKNGGESGDLYIQVKILDHEIFTRNQSDLYCELPISFTKATLGGEIEVPSLKGKIKIKIPKETQTNKVFRIKNKGIKNLKTSNYGDLFCKVVIETPINLNSEQIELLNKFENSIESINNPKENLWVKLSAKFFNNLKL